MRKILSASLLSLGLAAILTSCAITMPKDVTNNPVGSKTGRSSSIVLFHVFYLNGNYSLMEAVKNGGIKGGVSTVDIKTSNYLLFSKQEIIVTGE